MKTVALCAIAIFLSTTCACSWVGRTAGKAQAKMERKIESVEHGYKEGYASETKKR